MTQDPVIFALAVSTMHIYHINIYICIGSERNISLEIIHINYKCMVYIYKSIFRSVFAEAINTHARVGTRGVGGEARKDSLQRGQ